jgi:hypothetical protein
MALLLHFSFAPMARLPTAVALVAPAFLAGHVGNGAPIDAVVRQRASPNTPGTRNQAPTDTGQVADVSDPADRPRRPPWVVPLALFLVALVVRLLVIPLVQVAPNEGSAYYVGVAANLVGGHGLVSDAVWSYATPPYVVPKPAFELWLPMATFVAALPMALLGAGLGAAQLGMAVLGALVAPLAWLVGREAAGVTELDARRARGVAMTSGLLAAVLAPFVVATAGPDSTTPFLVFGTLAAVLAPRALAASERTDRGRRWWLPGGALGVALGLAWLSRQEAIWIGAAYLGVLAVQLRAGAGPRRPRAVAALVPVVVGGLIVVGPWLLRDLAVFGSPFPGQAVDNLWLRRNEDIFAWRDRPTAAGYLGQGLGVVVGDRVGAAVHQLVSVLVVPAFPVGLVGLVALVGLRRSPAVRRPTALAVLLLGGSAIFLATALLFPVATLWGTFLHSAGPLLVALAVTSALGADRLMARISVRRAWGTVNIIVAPMAMVAVAVLLLGLQLVTVARSADRLSARLAVVAADLEALLAADPTAPAVLMSDHPIWLADATERPAIALPDEPLEAVVDLASRFGSGWIVVLDERGRYPSTLLTERGHPCLAADPEPIGPPDEPAWLFRLAPACTPP